MAKKQLGPSEMEGRGPRKSGVFGLARAWEKLRVIYRTGQNPEPETDVNLDATPDDWGTGGLRDVRDKIT